MQKIKGFTLIELLIVISIIGILASLSLVSYGGAQKQSRDAIRKSDLEQYRNALEGYAGANGGRYPGYVAGGVVQIGTGNLCQTSDLYSFMSDTCLTDPNPTGTCTASSRQYCYFENGSSTGATATDYVLFSALETGGYWVICSNGKAGKATVLPASSTCPL